MRARLFRALTGSVLAVALTAIAPVAAHAQGSPTPTPTPTSTPSETATPAPSPTPTASPTPTPTPQPAKQNKYTRRVYRDFKRDGLIDACKHSRRALRRTLKTITPQFEDSYPDFRGAVKAAIKQHDKKRCVTPTPTPAPTAVPTTPPPTATAIPPAPAAPAPVVPAPVPVPRPKPPSSTTVPPAPTPTPTPTPVPTPTPPTAAQQEAQAIVSQPHEPGSLLVPGILLGLVALGAAGAGGSALLGSRYPRFAAVGHAWREAAFRAGGAWGSFTDWMRLGR